MTEGPGPFEMGVLAVAPLILFLGWFYKNEEVVMYFLYHTLPIVFVVLVGSIVVIWSVYYSGKGYVARRKRMKEELEKSRVTEKKQAEECFQKRQQEDALRKFKESLLNYQHLLVGEMTEERKQQLANAIAILSRSDICFGTCWRYLQPFRDASAKIDEYFVDKNHEREEHLDLVASSFKDDGVYLKKDLGDEEIGVLTGRMNYQEYTSQPLKSQRTYKYLVHPRSNESVEHFFLVKQLEEYLELVVHDIRTPESRDADIVFKVDKDTYALEVETGSNLKSKAGDIQEKIKLLNRNYKDNWFIVVTHRDLIPKYKKYCLRVYNRSTIVEQLNKILGEHGREFPANT